MAEVLSPDDVQARVDGLTGWRVIDGKLHREFTFSDFVQAFGFMTEVAVIAEKLNHHPDWSNSWNKVTIDIVNHSAGGLTELDFELASQINTRASTGRSA